MALPLLILSVSALLLPSARALVPFSLRETRQVAPLSSASGMSTAVKCGAVCAATANCTAFRHDEGAGTCHKFRTKRWAGKGGSRG